MKEKRTQERGDIKRYTETNTGCKGKEIGKEESFHGQGK